MPKLTVLEAEKLVSKGKSTIYNDMDTGKLSFEINARGKKVIDLSELQRVYGPLKSPQGSENGNSNGNSNGHPEIHELDTSGKNNGTPDEVEFLQAHIHRLEAELERAGKREAEFIEEKRELRQERKKLLNMLSTEQEKTKLLMLTGGTEKKKPSWLNYLRLKR